MYSATVNVAGQRMDLKVDQKVGEPELQRILADVKAGITKMRPGWIMASDLRGLLVVHPSFNQYLVEVQKAVTAASAGKIATLVDSHVLKLQLSVNSKAAQSGGISQRFDNEQEWNAFIARK